MEFMRVFVYLFLSILFFACNTAEQKSVSQSSTTTSSIKSATFIYNVSKIVLTENTTSARFVPVEKFEGSFYRVLPTLPAGLTLNTSTGEISGVPTETLTETEFLVEVDTVSGTEYAFLNMAIRPEAPKSIDYPFTTLSFNKGQIGSYTPTTSGGTIDKFKVTPSLPSWLLLNNTTGALETNPLASLSDLDAQMIPGSTFHTITASNETGSTLTTVLVSVNDAPPVGLSYTNDAQGFVINGTPASTFNHMVPSFSTLTPTPINVTYTISPQLPAGLFLAPDGVISGSPEAKIGTTNYTVTASNDQGNTSTVTTITITEPAASLLYDPSTFEVEQNVAISPIQVKTYLGGPDARYRCFVDANSNSVEDLAEVGTCPAWLNIDPLSGLITGTPDTIGVTIVTILTENADNSSVLAGTPTPPVDVLTFNVIEDKPNDPNDLGYNDSYTLTENQSFSITPKNSGGAPSFTELIGHKARETNGGANTFSTLGGIATFTTSLVGVGAGDALHFDSDNNGKLDSAIFIRTKISDTIYEVYNSASDGDNAVGAGNPLSITAGTTATFTNDIAAAIDTSSFILYDSDNNGSFDAIADISAEPTPNRVFTVTALGGGAATNVTSTERWIIHYNSTVANVGPIGDWIIYNGLPAGVTFIEGILAGTPNLTLNGSTTCTQNIGSTFPLQIDARNILDDSATTNQLTDITTGVASFSANVSSAVAVNDILYYDSDGAGGNDSFVQVTAVNSPTSFNVQKLDGLAVPDTGVLNDLDWNFSSLSGSQSVSLEVRAIAPTRLGYTTGRSGSIFNNGIFELTDGSPILASDLIAPNDFTGGAAEQFTVSPRLPKGLNLDTCTGIISGTPREITPIKNYTITATNSAGSFSETIAISTNNLIAPSNLVYNDTNSTCLDDQPSDNDLTFTLFSNSTETPCYFGSDASFSISPALPSGLVLNTLTGEISGTPVTTDGNTNTFTITATNSMGTLSTQISLTMNNLALLSEEINYIFNSSPVSALNLIEGDTLSIGDLSIQVANNPSNQSGAPSVFTANITTVPNTGPLAAAAVTESFLTLASGDDPKNVLNNATQTSNIVLNASNGDLTTFIETDASSQGVQPTVPRELTPNPSLVVLDFDNINVPSALLGGSNALTVNTAPTPSQASFAVDLATSVGAGDLLSYDSNADGIYDKKVRVVSVVTPSPTVLEIAELDGTKVTSAVTAEQSWRLNDNATLNGTGNNLTINIVPLITTANFVTPLTTVGVGDILSYDSVGDTVPDTRVLISSVVSTTQFEVTALNGSKATVVQAGSPAAIDDWVINNAKVFTLLVNERALDFDYTGGANTLTVTTGKISGTALHYDSDNDSEIDAIAYLSSRIDDQNFHLVSARGGPIADMTTADNEWYISGNYIQGLSNDLTINAGAADFEFPVNLRVGDRLSYDSDADGSFDTVAEVTVVTDPQNYTVIQAGVGGNPPNVTNIEQWATKAGQTGDGINLQSITGGNTATFSTPIDAQIGDTLRYDFNGSGTANRVAIITSRTNATTFGVTSTDGGAATNTTVANDQDWILSSGYFQMLNTLTVTGGNSATWASPLDRIPSVGDIIAYDSDGASTGLDSFAIITVVNSASSFDISALNGTAATNTAGVVSDLGEWEIISQHDAGSFNALTIKDGIATFAQAIIAPFAFDGGDMATGAADHSGGPVALTRDGTAENLCSANLISTTRIPSSNPSLTDTDQDGFHDSDLLNIPGSALYLNPDNCNIEYTGNVCASDTVTGNDTILGGSGDPLSAGNVTLEYRIQAFNSGSPSGFTRNVTVNYFDRPNFLYQPDLNFSQSKYSPKNGYVTGTSEFETSKNLNLSGNVVNSSGAPDTTNRCHEGNFSLSLLSNLPSNIFAFNSTDGSVRITNAGIFARDAFTLTSTETLSGLNFSQTENITIQASHVIDNAGDATRELYATKFDLNSDGNEDIIIRSRSCEDHDGDGISDNPDCDRNGGFANFPTVLYTQDSGISGLLNNHENTFPTFQVNNAFALTPIIYDTGQSGIVFVKEEPTPAAAGNIIVTTMSTTTASHTDTINATNQPGGASVGAGRFAAPVGVVPNRVGVSSGFGVVIDTGDRAAGDRPIIIDQYSFDTSFQTLAAAGTATINLQNNAGGGIELGAGGSIQIVTHNDTDGDGNMDIVIGYTDMSSGSAESFICVVKSNGTDFLDTCNPREPIPNNGNIKDIKFANITNDVLDEMFVLSNDGTNNEITVFENRNITDIAGSYQSIDQVVLKTLPSQLLSFPNFDVADANKDGFLDLIVSDQNGDIDRDTNANDGVVSGLSVYRNTQNSSDPFSENVSQIDEFPTLLHYSNSAGNTNEVEMLRSGLDLLIFHCQIDTDDTNDPDGTGPLTSLTPLRTTSGLALTNDTPSSCGIIGRF